MDLNIQAMSREEKLRVMHALWEDLANEADLIESPAWHVETLEETEESVKAGKEDSRDWEEAKEELRKRIG